MWVNFAKSEDWTVKGPNGKFFKAFAQMRRHLVTPLLNVMKTDNNNLHSPNIFPSSWSKKINKSDADIAHLHWVGAEMASIKDIGGINKPVIWTLHDMWAFLWSENMYRGIKDGEMAITKKIGLIRKKALMLIARLGNRKIKYWKRPFNIVAVSNWLADCAKNSKLMKDWPTTVIPNCLNTQIWKPEDKKLARILLLGSKIYKLLDLVHMVQILNFIKVSILLWVGLLDNLREEMKDLELGHIWTSSTKREPDLRI